MNQAKTSLRVLSTLAALHVAFDELNDIGI